MNMHESNKIEIAAFTQIMTYVLHRNDWVGENILVQYRDQLAWVRLQERSNSKKDFT